MYKKSNVFEQQQNLKEKNAGKYQANQQHLIFSSVGWQFEKFIKTFQMELVHSLMQQRKQEKKANKREYFICY